MKAGFSLGAGTRAYEPLSEMDERPADITDWEKVEMQHEFNDSLVPHNSKTVAEC